MSEWTKVPGYEHIEVTSDGRVRTAAHEVTRLSRWKDMQRYVFKAREYRTWISDNGYVRVVVQRKGKRGPIYVHRLVAFAFVDGYRAGFHVNHINGIKTDNRAENLEWVPNAQNIKHAWKTGLVDTRGDKNGSRVLSAQRVRAIRRALALGVPANALAVIAGVCHNTIDRIKSGATWQSVQG